MTENTSLELGYCTPEPRPTASATPLCVDMYSSVTVQCNIVQPDPRCATPRPGRLPAGSGARSVPRCAGSYAPMLSEVFCYCLLHFAYVLQYTSMS